VYFLSGGSEATETALKLARQYHVARGEPERSVFISRRQSYHGNTLGALGVSGNAGRRAMFEPLLTQGERIAPCHAYREQASDETLDEYGRRAALELAAAIERLGPKRVAAFIAEPVVGATLGAAAAAPGYFQLIREICDAHGVLFIADEVMSGLGRCGERFAIEAEGVVPDMICTAKGLAGGYQPIGAVLLQSRIFDAIINRHGHFEHGHTYIGHPIACAAALAVQKGIEEQNLIAAVRSRGAYLDRRLRQALEQNAFVGDIRGRGLLYGVEFVTDRESKSPFLAGDRISPRIKAAALERGLICYPGSGTADGLNGDHILLAPPFIATEQHLDELVDTLAAAIRDVLGDAT
jgi:adenosylmethionine-8-amino-7-oxononanoate aminotransferase